MSVRFDTRLRLVVVRAEIDGPSGTGVFRFALDTGASTTLINASLLTALGYDPSLANERIEITTASGVEYAAVLPIRRIHALGRERLGLPVLCHTLPPSTGVDGLLGLNFLRGHVLTVDFPEGRIDLA
jgi:predicted aspartyl protease